MSAAFTSHDICFTEPSITMYFNHILASKSLSIHLTLNFEMVRLTRGDVSRQRERERERERARERERERARVSEILTAFG